MAPEEPFTGNKEAHYETIASPSERRWQFPEVTEVPRLRVIEGGLGQVASGTEAGGWKCNVSPIRPPAPEDIVA